MTVFYCKIGLKNQLVSEERAFDLLTMTSNFLCFEALHIVGAKFHLNKALYINLLLYIFLMPLIRFA